MVTPLAAPAFFTVTLSSFTANSINKPTILMFRGGTNRSLEFNGNYRHNFTPASPLQLKRHPRFYLNGKERQCDDMNADDERLLEHGLAFQQNFTIRSFEIGSDFKISIETLMNYLQDAGVNHLKSAGILANGTLGATAEMDARDLIWVVYGLDMADVVQVETWIYKSGRNSFCREWRVHDLKTGETPIQAASLHVVMNKKTRKIVKFSEEVIKDFKPFLLQRDPHIHKTSTKLLQLDTSKADYVRTSLTPGWTDMDINEHVSHIKLVNYVLESVPSEVVESHKISAITLDYRKECNRDCLLQSFSRVTSSNRMNELMDNGEIEFDHLLCLECGQEIVRGNNKWKPKCEDNSTCSLELIE
ncbi:palmitoyl-acyl carrier protein thioesterase, chloroplastic-like [Pistacia vera]|uniref:palmitoyl-acyl carrier protein thioesterase, chloroplastic-like n=1 Tax=Pistacia vera TaxID=55513 RepID=UPI0012630634|nr:palmitoyl-acyl carrier protein thioesterase, chloroplastic-like [Pistacia vera]